MLSAKLYTDIEPMTHNDIGNMGSSVIGGLVVVYSEFLFPIVIFSLASGVSPRYSIACCT
jgi:hypothetical protein